MGVFNKISSMILNSLTVKTIDKMSPSRGLVITKITEGQVF